LALAELILLHRDSQTATLDKDKELTKSHRRSIASLGLELGFARNTGAIFTAFPGVPNRSFDGSLSTEDALRDSFVTTGHHTDLNFSDLIITHSTVVTHKMHNHSWLFAVMRLAGKLIQRNTTALTDHAPRQFHARNSNRANTSQYLRLSVAEQRNTTKSTMSPIRITSKIDRTSRPRT
jgi:hypothetical protein